MKTLFALLWPRARGVRNRWERSTPSERATYAMFGVVSLFFWLAIFAGMAWLVHAFHGVEVFGPILTRKLLELMLLSLFGLLCFSNVVTALSTFYLSDDLQLLLALPVRREHFHFARLSETVAQSSWMMLVFGVPVFAAYGVTHEAPWTFYALLLLVVPSFVLYPAAVGLTVASLLVSVFPARRLRELLVVAGLGALGALFTAFRVLRPERLVDPESFESLAAYVAEVQAPIPLLIPPRWASDVLIASLMQRPFPWVELGLLVTGAIATTGVARWITMALYDDGRAKAQEARSARFASSRLLESFLRWSTRPLPVEARALVTKDTFTFVRDPAQWSQLIVITSILLIVLTSVSSFPVDTLRGPWMGTFRDILAFLLLGLVGFVMAAIAARFLFTAVSGEGRAFWWVRTGPIDPELYLWSKVWPVLPVMIVMGEALAVPSTLILGAGPFLVAVAAGTALCLAFGLSGIAAGMGALYPDFKLDNAARAAAGPAGMLFMVAALSLVAVVIALEAWPVYVVLRARVLDQPITTEQLWLIALLLSSAAVVCIAATILPIRIGARRLWARELLLS